MSKVYYKGGCKFMIAKGVFYCMDPMFLDIETSNNHADKPEDLRTWISSIQVRFKGKYYLFRYPEEFIDFLKGLINKLCLKPGKFKKKLIIFVHNLSYDISYLYGYLQALPTFGETYQGILEDNNKFLTYVRGPFEFRCSYRLSGMSLEKWSKEMNIEHKKKTGLYDYDKIIYPDDELTENEQTYDQFDVLAMEECLNKQMSYYGDDLTTLPLTKTGYIRRTLRRSCRNDRYYRKHYFWDNRLDAHCYEYCLKSFAGGYTHNNRFWRDIIIQTGKTYEYIPNSGIYYKVDKIKHRDFKSHYPTQQTCSNRFPVGRPQHIYDNNMHYALSIPDILKEIDEFTYFVKMRITYAELRDRNCSMPFLQFSKCYQCEDIKKTADNGRILKIEGSFITYMDSITMSIIAEQYTMEYEIIDAYRMKNGPLPACIVSVIDKYFKGKSDKKSLVHQLEKEFGKTHPKTMEAAFDLQWIKADLNGIYGCCVQQSLKNELQVDSNCKFSYKKTYITEDEVTEGLENYYHGKNNFLAYQVGCVVTSLARLELFEYIKAVGYDRVLYADTDSLFYISNDEVEKRIEALNSEKRKTAHYVTLENGQKEYYNEFTEEPDPIAFKGLHSKCYGVVTAKGLEITIAGVPARTLVKMEGDTPVYFTREEELSKGETDPIKALDNLTDNFTFKVNSGVCALYIGALGYNTLRKPEIININGHEIHTCGGCVIQKLDSKKIVLDPDNKKKKKAEYEDINPDSI